MVVNIWANMDIFQGAVNKLEIPVSWQHYSLVTLYCIRSLQLQFIQALQPSKGTTRSANLTHFILPIAYVSLMKTISMNERNLNSWCSWIPARCDCTCDQVLWFVICDLLWLRCKKWANHSAPTPLKKSTHMHMLLLTPAILQKDLFLLI